MLYIDLAVYLFLKKNYKLYQPNPGTMIRLDRSQVRVQGIIGIIMQSYVKYLEKNIFIKFS